MMDIDLALDVQRDDSARAAMRRSSSASNHGYVRCTE